VEAVTRVAAQPETGVAILPMEAVEVRTTLVQISQIQQVTEQVTDK